MSIASLHQQLLYISYNPVAEAIPNINNKFSKKTVKNIFFYGNEFVRFRKQLRLFIF